VLYHVTMEVRIPLDADPALVAQRVADERAASHDLQRGGEWRHLWRMVGRYANVSIFDVADHARLHEILSGLPLFAWMEITVSALTTHPSALPEATRDAAGGAR